MGKYEAKSSVLAVNIPDGLYNVFRRIVELVLPGMGALYATLSQVWGDDVFPAPHKVIASCAALAVFLGIFLSMSRKAYEANATPGEPPGGYDGAVVEDVTENGEPILRLQLDTSAAEDLLNKKQLVIKGYDPTA